MFAYTTEGEHTEEACIRRRDQRCRKCGKWHMKGTVACPLRQVKCGKRDGSVIEHFHTKVEFVKCEICAMKKWTAVPSICPLVLPRCARHAITECEWCGDMLDLSIKANNNHTCVLLENQLSQKCGRRIIKVSDTVYITQEREGVMHQMYVQTPYNVPNMMSHDKTIVCLIDSTFLVFYEMEGTIARVGDLFPQRFCASCITTVQNVLKYCKCREVMYCGKDCQKLDWDVHKQFCKLANQLKK